MSTVIVKDGTGSGNSQKVDVLKRAHTQSVTVSENLNAALNGDAYNINTGLISITGNATLLYIKNNEEVDIVVEALALGSFEGITHSDDPYITLIKNPTAGDLITDATAVSMNQNRNHWRSRCWHITSYSRWTLFLYN
jgi:hypothetical protein